MKIDCMREVASPTLMNHIIIRWRQFLGENCQKEKEMLENLPCQATESLTKQLYRRVRLDKTKIWPDWLKSRVQ